MALLALGSVTVAANGDVTKSGECAQVYDLLYADAEAAASNANTTLPTGPDSVPFKRGLARLATTMATYVYMALTTRAQAKIATTDTSLQRLPTVILPDANTQGPSANRFISIV